MSTTEDTTVLGGHDVAEFRLTEDGKVEVFSTEENDDGEQMGTVVTMEQDDLRAIADALKAVRDGADEAEAPDVDGAIVGQHPLFGALVIAREQTDDDGNPTGEPHPDFGTVWNDHRIIVDAAEALP